MRHWFLLALAVVPLLAAQSRSFDVVIAGAGTGGVSAAIQAARMGATVALLEETDWIGGQATAAGVPNMDEARFNLDSGIYAEFIGRVRAHYVKLGKSIGTCYWGTASQCFEPHVGRQILRDMLREAGRIELIERTRVRRVLAKGRRVTGVVTSRGATLHSKVLIDATEFGDVLPLTPAAWRVGRCLQDITYTAVIRKYPGGVPAELRLATPPPGYSDAMRAQFAAGVRGDGNSRLQTPVNWAFHNAYRGLPDSATPGDQLTRTVLNWFNDYPVTEASFSASERKNTVCAAKLKTLQFLYYMQREPGNRDWSIANDEGFDSPYNREENLCADIPAEFKAVERHFPVMPYVRESRRLVGLHTLTAPEIRREGSPAMAVTNFPTSIAVGDYAVDLHGCKDDSDLEAEFEHASDVPPGFRGGVFQVPVESLIPLDTDGLLAAEKNISQSRLANGATRLQPITMLTGQAAGALAALAARGNIPPRAVNRVDLQKALLQAGSKLALQRFADISRDHPLWAAVELAVTRGWLQPASKDRFGADDVLAGVNGSTRGEAVASLWKEGRP